MKTSILEEPVAKTKIPIHRKSGVFDPKTAKGLHSRMTDFRLEGTLSHAPSNPLSMSADESSLGRCPDCGERIPTAWRLIDYEKDDGTEGVWAECPACSEVVAPE